MKIFGVSVGEFINFCCFTTSLCLVIVGFILPPTGVIDSSVLMAVGELGIFSTISKIPDFIKALKNGASMTVTKGETTIEIEGPEENKKNESK